MGRVLSWGLLDPREPEAQHSPNVTIDTSHVRVPARVNGSGAGIDRFRSSPARGGRDGGGRDGVAGSRRVDVGDASAASAMSLHCNGDSRAPVSS